MATVSSTSSTSTSYSIDDVISQAVDVSEATTLENSFITLMVAQIQNQDPTNPVDSTEFLNQYAAMSQVKSLENLASLSKSNLVLMDNLQTLTAAGLVGQEVKVSTDQVVLGDGAVSGLVDLENAAGSLTLTLTSASGVKKTIELGTQSAGTVAFTLDAEALGLAAGTYTISASSDSGEYPDVEIAGLVKQVRVSTDGPVLEVAGVGSVPFYKITEFGQSTASSLL